MPIYMKYESIDGSVTAAGYERWIELLSCSHGTGRAITNPTGNGVNRQAGGPNVLDITVTMRQDAKASTKLFKEALWGEGKMVEIHYVKTDQNKFEPTEEITLWDVLISSFSESGEGGDNHHRPMQQMALNFTKILYNPREMDPKNKTGKMYRVQWDVATATVG